MVEMKSFLKLADVVKFMNWRHIMQNSDKIVLQFKQKITHVFDEAIEYVRMTMLDVVYIYEFCHIRPYDPVDWIVKYMIDKFQQGNYIFKCSGKDIEKGLCVM